MINRPDTNAQRIKRHKRVRAKINGTAERPRLNVFRSLQNIYAQLIDDVKGVTLASASTPATNMHSLPTTFMLKNTSALFLNVQKNSRKRSMSGGPVYWYLRLQEAEKLRLRRRLFLRRLRIIFSRH